VHSYKRNGQHEAKFKELFVKDKEYPRLDDLARVDDRSAGHGPHFCEERTRFVLRGYMGVQDADDSEATFSS
jgi:hypothetical protein